MRLIVNDANILIDLVELNLLQEFFRLNFEFYTTDLILNELFSCQYHQLLPFLKDNKLISKKMTAYDLSEIRKIEKSKPKLSQQDCSALFQAYKHSGTLITSDNNLRKFAQSKSLEVHGHLWVFDEMIAQKTIPPLTARSKLKLLITQINPRLHLPFEECEKRLENWKN